ncbi:hypothetical protein F2Q68_00045587 [Brassica cretica]|uniref:Uncharacterized protein n=1 Tax=Brassica cretica TaxID=69181 RepID=A0A8S9LP74_BRACR|nr:hypothetical protein F2Q68_00045587 [Brassica cretica]
MATSAHRAYAFGRADEATHPDSIRATLAEFLSTFVFVFAAEGSILSLDKLYWSHAAHAGTNTPGGLVLVALAHAFALFATVSAAINVSGGHVNPAVTFGALIGGRLSAIRAIYYWIAQLLGAILACLLLRLSTNGMRPVGFRVASGVGAVNGLILEIILTFGLVYVVYSTLIDPKRGRLHVFLLITPNTETQNQTII